ncbi:MAG: nuclear transport factor 2 family protein [Thermomicrobiales bacterium]
MVRPSSAARRSWVMVIVAAAFALGLLVQGLVASAQDSNQTDTTADKAAITELAAKFETTFDQGDFDTNVDLWTDDGVFDHPAGVFKGKEAYRQWAEGFYQQSAASGGSHHLLTNVQITVNGDQADMTSYLTLLVGITSPAPAIISGEFTDHVVKVDGEWKFQTRKLVIATQFGPPQSGGATPVAST